MYILGAALFGRCAIESEGVADGFNAALLMRCEKVFSFFFLLRRKFFVRRLLVERRMVNRNFRWYC